MGSLGPLAGDTGTKIEGEKDWKTPTSEMEVAEIEINMN